MNDEFERTGFHDPFDWLHAGENWMQPIKSRSRLVIDSKGLLWELVLMKFASGLVVVRRYQEQYTCLLPTDHPNYLPF